MVMEMWPNKEEIPPEAVRWEEVISTRHPLSQRFHDVLAEMGRTHDAKQADYGRENDPFANVRATEEWGQPAWVGAMIRATDKLRRLQNVARGGTLKNESARDSFLDLAVYAVIGLVLWEEDHMPGSSNAKTPSAQPGNAGSTPAPGSSPNCGGKER